MKMIFIFCLFMIGACLFSFVNVVSLRIPLHMNFLTGKSACPYCHHELTFVDMFPLFGWVFLKGKCRYCHHRLSIRYFLMELFGGLLFLLCFYDFGFQLRMLISFAFIMLFVAIALIDEQTMMIPDELIVVGLVLDMFYFLVLPYSWWEHVLGFFMISVPVYLLNICYKESFGGGDIKLLAVSGFFLGWQKIFIAMMIAVISASCYAFYLCMIKRIKKNQYMAFAPFITGGIIISLFYGERLMFLYEKCLWH